MFRRLTALFAGRCVLTAATICLAAALATAQPALAQYQCQPGHYDVVVPGYVVVPASVDVACSGSITTMDIQWPFNDPSPEAWHNRYELNAADLSCSITVGEVWLCTLQWIANEGGTTRYVIAGCPEIYGGTGQPVPWSDPCIQKVRNRIYPDFWIFKHVVAQNGSAGLKLMSRILMGFALDVPPGDGTGDVPQPPLRPGGSETTLPLTLPDFADPTGSSQSSFRELALRSRNPAAAWPRTQSTSAKTSARRAVRRADRVTGAGVSARTVRPSSRDVSGPRASQQGRKPREFAPLERLNGT